tara:strand:- start:3520 stop:3723 length:204 start_codon:yes stop_codon:yes gene_type:complete
MSNPKKPWEDIPFEIIIEEERKEKERQAEKEKQRPRLPLPLYCPHTASNDPSQSPNAINDTIITFKL